MKEIMLTPTRELGYLCGVVLGDGSLIFSRKIKRNTKIRFGSTKKEFIALAESAIKRVFPELHLCRWTKYETRKFPNGTVRTDWKYYVDIHSKILYDALRPFKLPDSRWNIPSFLTTRNSILGFLQGLFDAEGHFSVKSRHIGLTSKHRENLSQIQSILSELGIRSFIYNHQPGYRLLIFDGLSKRRFANLINFKIAYKREALREDLGKYRRYSRPKGAADKFLPDMIKLRKQGCTYEQITKLIGVPTMTVWRRLNNVDFKQQI